MLLEALTTDSEDECLIHKSCSCFKLSLKCSTVTDEEFRDGDRSTFYMQVKPVSKSGLAEIRDFSISGDDDCWNIMLLHEGPKIIPDVTPCFNA